ncbi:hypothetical protein BJ322DRAFT_345539 [Thelephora terrestris]|uniref:Uncharacterized protein n=1 Tax=Thelephora terrestris TaxID=56493 RepID=A0A9P6H733_9AGAM|nr:hypothetical protein BJ322DRAFT_345539 [Thelephora terrestris]
MDPGLSPTTSIHIRFSEVDHGAQNHVAIVGAGLISDDVYAVHDPLGVGVADGHVTEVGVGGSLLGGGRLTVTDALIRNF